jgi:UDP-3-O-[3-hydroxymyristoyl] glucosamine N-acyltransferase
MHKVVINNNTKIVRNCLMKTCCIIEHDVIIGDNCYIAPGAII